MLFSRKRKVCFPSRNIVFEFSFVKCLVVALLFWMLVLPSVLTTVGLRGSSLLLAMHLFPLRPLSLSGLRLSHVIRLVQTPADAVSPFHYRATQQEADWALRVPADGLVSKATR